MFCNELFSSVWSRYVHDNNDHLDVNNPNDDDYSKLFRKKCRLVMWGYKRGNSYNPQYSRLVVFPETIDLFGSFWKKQTRPSPTGRKCKPCEWLLWWNRPRCMRVRVPSTCNHIFWKLFAWLNSSPPLLSVLCFIYIFLLFSWRPSMYTKTSFSLPRLPSYCFHVFLVYRFTHRNLSYTKILLTSSDLSIVFLPISE